MATDSSKKENVGKLPNNLRGKFTDRAGGVDKPDDVQTPGTGGGNTGTIGPGNGGGSSSYTPKPVYGLYESPPGTVANVGYEVLVLAGPSYTEAIALISSHQGLSISRQLSGDGGGSISLNRDSPLFYNAPAAPSNLIPNPDFTTSQSGSYAWGWQVNSLSAAATYGASNQWINTAGGTSTSLYVDTPGTSNARINTLEGTSGIGVSPGVLMTASAQARPTATGRPTRLYVDFYKADGTFVGIGKSLYSYPVYTEPDVINFLRVEGIVPTGASYAAVGAEVVATGIFNERHLFDNFSFHPTTASTPFYDGRDKSDIIDKENLWEVYYNGARVHEFIGTVRSQDLVNPSESRSVTVSGVGTIELLKRARVLPQAWALRDGKPWVVSPIKLLKEDFQSAGEDTSALNTKVWNKKLTMNVAVDQSDFTYSKIQLRNINPALVNNNQSEMIGSGPWNFRNGAKLFGDASGIPNTLYFEIFPYLIPDAQTAGVLDVDSNKTIYLAADFISVFEIFIDSDNRCYVAIRSVLTDTGVLTHRFYCTMRGKKAAAATADDFHINAGDWVPYNYTTHRWLRFQMNSTNTSIIVEYSPTGLTGTWVQFGSTPITEYPTWVSNLDQVTFRVYSYFTGLLHAYAPEGSRPIGGAGQQGYLPGVGVTDNVATALLPVGDVLFNGQFFTNPAITSFGKINDNGSTSEDHTPSYDQMGYFKWKGENAKATRDGVLYGVDFQWETGDFRPGQLAPAHDSIGNLRRGLTQTYYRDKDGEQINALMVNGPVETLVPNLLAKPDSSYIKPDGKWYYPKYTHKQDSTREIFLVKVKVTEPVEGQTFYDYFVQSCNIAKCDWSMQPGRRLCIYDTDPLLVNGATVLPDMRETVFNQPTMDPVTGNPALVNANMIRQTVFFHEGYSTVSKQMARSSESIVNYVIGHDTKGNYVVAKDAASIAKWGVREAWVDVDYQDPTAVSLETAVSTILAIGVNELESWTINVPVMDGTYSVTKTVGGVTTIHSIGAPYAEAVALYNSLRSNSSTPEIYNVSYNKDGTRPFVDYKEGDWISVAQHTGADPTSSAPQYDMFRVMAISLTVDTNSVETVELTLTSLVESRMKLLQDKLNNVSATSQVATATIPPVSAYAQISSVSLGTLADVSVSGAVPNSYLRLNAAGTWVAQPPDPTPASLPTSFTSAAMGDGSATTFVVQHGLKSVNVAIKVYAVKAGAGGTSRAGVTTFIGEDITNFQALQTQAPATTVYTVPTAAHTHTVSGSATGGPSATQSVTVPVAPVLLKTAIPIIMDENKVKIAFSNLAPFQVPAAGSFRVVVIRGGSSATG